jgi:hypothetical protein
LKMIIIEKRELKVEKRSSKEAYLLVVVLH